MTLLVILLTAWGVVTAALICLMIYRSVVGMREDDQLFLDPAQAQLEQDQKDVIASLNRTMPYLKILGAMSGVLLAVIAGLWVYEGLSRSAGIR